MDHTDRLLEQPVVIRLAHALLQRAIGDGATELRFLPAARVGGVWSPMYVEYRADGVWTGLPSCPQIPGPISRSILRRFQIMADVNPFSKKGPQAGTFRFHDEEEGQRSRDHVIHAAFHAGKDGITTTMTIRAAEDEQSQARDPS